jgi:hypothetical protein
MTTAIPDSHAWRSASLGADWLLSLLQPDGSLKGATDFRAYYKTPAALLAHGHTREAHLILDHIADRYLKPDGDLDTDGVPWISIYRTYLHSWLCCSAMMAGRFEMAHKVAAFIATHHNPASGGFFADEAHTTEEIMTTSMAGLASLWAGNLTLASAAGRWLENLYNAQPDLTKGLYTTWRDGLVTDYPDDEAPSFRIDPAKARQYYFQYGISAALLTSLHGATGDNTWLTLAEDFLDASAHAGPDKYQTPQSGKIGWGAAWTYRHTKDPQHLALVNQVVATLVSLQNDDGSWLVTGVYGGATAPADSVTIDITSEFVTLQSFMAQVPHV